MSIQRYDYSGVLANIDVDEWVSYEDHFAEVQELRNQLFKHHHLYYRQLWEDAVNACIAVVESYPIPADDITLQEIVVDMRKVQP